MPIAGTFPALNLEPRLEEAVLPTIVGAYLVEEVFEFNLKTAVIGEIFTKDCPYVKKGGKAVKDFWEPIEQHRIKPKAKRYR